MDDILLLMRKGGWDSQRFYEDFRRIGMLREAAEPAGGERRHVPRDVFHGGARPYRVPPEERERGRREEGVALPVLGELLTERAEAAHAGGDAAEGGDDGEQREGDGEQRDGQAPGVC